jgi:hypothetical protein
MSKISEKRPYEKPVLEYCGPVAERTLGQNGSNWDNGQQSYLKLGHG